MVEAQTQMPAGLLPLASQPAIVASRWLVVASADDQLRGTDGWTDRRPTFQSWHRYKLEHEQIDEYRQEDEDDDDNVSIGTFRRMATWWPVW